ncbi:hypothetical protein [Pontibacter oryzae]|uniref:STAS/SEC14 domain-containing protein n=1 Tax=Pontibacter oryzae TaxID=2304593 RepID=A0A399RUV0_9BACT|nr:hypothetical protein [Pontibacter oryzae]RIJ34064.1 hypothetical protein D1627_17020 [Pontibacter oryzae]
MIENKPQEHSSFHSHMLPVFCNDYIHIEKSETASFLEVVWKKALQQEEYRLGMEAFIQCATATQAQLVLIDYTKMPAPTLADQAWAGTHAMPQLRKSGIERLARLLSVDIFQNLALDNIFRLAQPLSYAAENFAEKETALKWLFRK